MTPELKTRALNVALKAAIMAQMARMTGGTSMSQLLASAGIAAAALPLAGCAYLPVQGYPYAAPAGYNHSQTYGYIHGDYAPDGVYVGTRATPASPIGVQPYVIPTPAPFVSKLPAANST
jgi:hypothetical protein